MIDRSVRDHRDAGGAKVVWSSRRILALSSAIPVKLPCWLQDSVVRYETSGSDSQSKRSLLGSLYFLYLSCEISMVLSLQDDSVSGKQRNAENTDPVVRHLLFSKVTFSSSSSPCKSITLSQDKSFVRVVWCACEGNRRLKV